LYLIVNLEISEFSFFLQWTFANFTFYLSFHNHCLLHWWNNHCHMHSKMNKFIFIKRIKIIHYFHHSCAKKTNSCGQKYFQFLIQRTTHKNLKKSRKNAKGNPTHFRFHTWKFHNRHEPIIDCSPPIERLQ